MRISDVLSLHDLEPLARAHLPCPLFAYVSGAVEDGHAFAGNPRAYAGWAFAPRVLAGVQQRSTEVDLFGVRYAAPFGIAPMGLAAMVAYDGDRVIASAAHAANIPAIMSGASLTRMEDVAAVAPRTWFQAYLPADDRLIGETLARAREAGFPVLVVTVDCACSANRENNIRAGYSTPLRPSPRLALQGLARPRWLLGTLARTLVSRGMPHFENLGHARGAPVLSRHAVRDFRPLDGLTWKHIETIRKLWPGKLVLKGVLQTVDARLAASHGADGIIVSNHGGRQFDGAMAPLHALPEIAADKRGLAVMIDSGIRRGTDVLKALALGADFAFVGRPFLYAAAIGGRPCVGRAAGLLQAEIDRNMALLGVSRPGQLDATWLRSIAGAHADASSKISP